MPATYADVIAGARVILNDSVQPYRNPETLLFGHVKQGVIEMVSMRYDLFTIAGTWVTAPGVVEQAIPSANAIYLVDIYSVNNAGTKTAIEECDLETLRRFQPSWRTDAAAAAENWMRFPSDGSKRDDAKYMLYPKSPVGQTVDGVFVSIPDMAADTTGSGLPVSDDYQPALEQYVVYRCECPNDESVMNARAKEAYANFRVLIGLAEAEPEQS